jgi:protein-S-isoprenylcysteine O-methyltransferase Ste14
MLFMIIGSAIDVNAYWAIVFIVAAVYFTYSAVVEERNMRQQFPKDYQAYKRTTKMLLPYIF